MQFHADLDLRPNALTLAAFVFDGTEPLEGRQS